MPNPETNRCLSTVATYQGEDTIRCELVKGHVGHHQTLGLFPNVWSTEAKMQNTETMTRAEALPWLASLEKNCSDCIGLGTCACIVCFGTGKVPVLPDLREPCPCPIYVYQTCEPCWQHGAIGHGVHCLNCQGCNWLPKQGRDALFEAMEKDGWGYEIVQLAEGERPATSGTRSVTFSKSFMVGSDADDYLAAAKAMKTAGY